MPKQRGDAVFPATHSILSAAALAEQVAAEYDVGEPRESRLLNRGLNDTYELTTGRSRYILRVYRARWRTLPEIRFELDFLLHLSQRGVAVSTPIARRDGGLVCALPAPEGQRQVVLFRYAPAGPAAVNVENCTRYGAVAAAIHNATEDFVALHPRPSLDLDYLLDQSIAAAQPLLEARPDDEAFLRRLVSSLKERLRGLPLTDLDWGICHGDLHFGNLHVDGAGRMTVFDFDLCGYGWRAMDLALQRAVMKRNGRDESLWTAFLRGYRANRDLAGVHEAAIALFVPVVCLVRDVGMGVPNTSDFGWGWAVQRLDTGMAFLRAEAADLSLPKRGR